MSAGYVLLKTLKTLGMIVAASIILILLSPLILLALLYFAGMIAYAILGLGIAFGFSYVLALLLNSWLHIPICLAVTIIVLGFSLSLVLVILDDHPISVPANQSSSAPSLLTALAALCLFNSFHDHDL
ncbi:MAG: hypothetical protein PHX14_01535 [Syntrophomonadaceae bacterium]|nr:hypothetical protein [Syntrophomonadaceae bacterium]